MVQDWAESTREIINYGRFIRQFPPDIIKSIRLLEKINKNIWTKNNYSVQTNTHKIYIYIYSVLSHHTPSSIMLTNQDFIFFVMQS